MPSADGFLNAIMIIGALTIGGAIGAAIMFALEWLGRLILPLPRDPYA